jgi:malate/lactate dehydrogenase
VKVSIVGCGGVGATLAHVLLQMRFRGEVLLLNRNFDRALGCYLDLTHASAFYSGVTFVPLSFANLAMCRGSDVIVLTAGSGLGPNALDRNLLAADNAKTLIPILSGLAACKDSVILVITNPVDTLTYLTAKYMGQLGLDSRRVIGLGTVVESARFRSYLATELNRRQGELSGKALVLGEHGSRMVAISSLLGPVELTYINDDIMDVTYMVRNAAQAIRVSLGAGPKYTIALCAWEVIGRVLGVAGSDGGEFLTVCSYVEQSRHYGLADVCLSLPTVIGKGGVERIVDITISTEERTSLQKCAAGLKDELGCLAAALESESELEKSIAGLCPR